MGGFPPFGHNNFFYGRASWRSLPPARRMVCSARECGWSQSREHMEETGAPMVGRAGDGLPNRKKSCFCQRSWQLRGVSGWVPKPDGGSSHSWCGDWEAASSGSGAWRRLTLQNLGRTTWWMVPHEEDVATRRLRFGAFVSWRASSAGGVADKRGSLLQAGGPSATENASCTHIFTRRCASTSPT